LSEQGLAAACNTVGVGGPEMWAVVSVETSGCGFLADRRPKILFERHYFSRLTDHKFDASHPDVSQPVAGGYGASGAHQYDRLAVAIGLDRTAALESASWGLGQIMVESEDRHIAALAAFVTASGFGKALHDHDWAGFARHYNGPDYAGNNYDGLLQHFYERYSAGPPPDLRVRAVQIYLTFKGISPGRIDGVMGDATAAAIRKFQQSTGVAPTGTIDDRLMQALAA
jgi:hypothetical protein